MWIKCAFQTLGADIGCASCSPPAGDKGTSHPVTAILYAPLGAPCTSELHAALVAAVTAHPNLHYALRPVLSDDCLQVREGRCNDGGKGACLFARQAHCVSGGSDRLLTCPPLLFPSVAPAGGALRSPWR